MDFAALEIFRAVARKAKRHPRGRAAGPRAINMTTRATAGGTARRPLFLREGKSACADPRRGAARLCRPPAGAGRRSASRCTYEPDGRLRLGAMAAARLRSLARLHAQWPGLVLRLLHRPLAPAGGAGAGPPSTAHWWRWPPPGIDADAPVERALRVCRGPAAGPARRPPARACSPGPAAGHPGRLQHRLRLPPHGREHPAAEGRQPAARAGAGLVHAILACVATGRCAGVVPQAVIDLMPNRLRCARCLWPLATRCWCTGAATSRPRWTRCTPH